MENNLKEYVKSISLRNIIIMVLFGIFMQLFATVIVTELLGHFADVSTEYSETIDNLTRLTFKMVFYVCIVAPVIEELCFRGIAMNIMSLKLPFIAANIIQALLFSIYHDNIVQKIYAFLLGLLIGYFVKSLKNIVYGITFHASMNAMGVIVNNFVGEIEGIFLKAAIIVITGACMILLFKLLYDKKNNENNAHMS